MSKTVNLTIPAMKCQGCVSAIEQALSSSNGILKFDVYLEIKTAVINSDRTMEDLIAIIKSAGFDATPVDSVEMEVFV